jgi:hypothetical protein
MKDIAVRAGKTAAQTFLAVLIPFLATGKLDGWQGIGISAGIAALAAALSVINNALINALGTTTPTI